MKTFLFLALVFSLGCIITPNNSIAEVYFDKSDSISFKRILNSWPVCIVAVEKDKYAENQWKVTAENGVVYYTNELPQIGDTAFYLFNLY